MTCIGDCLSKKKAAGIPINDQAIAICSSECRKQADTKMADYDYFRPIPVHYVTIPYRLYDE